MSLTEMKREAIPSSYFSPRAYVKADPSTALLQSRQGNRLLAVPELLLQSIFSTLHEEAGEAAALAFYTFGLSWGKSFYERARKEVEVYFGIPIGQMITADFFSTMQQAWAVHGLGKPIVDFTYAKKGILVVTIENSGISQPGQSTFDLEAGFIAGWFSGQTRQPLRAVASDQSHSPRRGQFIVGGASQIEEITHKYVGKGMRTPAILNALHF